MKYDAIEYILDGNWFYDYYQQMRNNKREIDAHIFVKNLLKLMKRHYQYCLKLLCQT